MHHKIISLIFLCACCFSYQGFTKTEINPQSSLKLTQQALPLIKKDVNQAIEILKNAIIADPKNDKAYYLLGNSLMAINNYHQAEIEYRKAYNIHPKDEYEIALARSLLLQSRADQVIDIVQYKGLNKKHTILKLNIYIFMEINK